MRLLSVVVLLALTPATASAQRPPRSVALEVGFSHDSADPLGDLAPVALGATWWLVGDLDATARLAWAFAPRTGVRGPDTVFEADVGLRQGLAKRPPFRFDAGIEIGWVQAVGAAPTRSGGVRLGAGLWVEVFLSRDVALGLVGTLGQVVLASAEGGPCAGVRVRVAAYF
jgi:hypothetical protein